MDGKEEIKISTSRLMIPFQLLNKYKQHIFAFIVAILVIYLLYIMFMPVSKLTGRYVILERVADSLVDNNAINVSEILVLDDMGEKIIASEVTAGSIKPNGKDGPEYLIDGKTGTFAQTDYVKEFEKLWFKLDLGSDKEISTIHVKNIDWEPTKPRISGTRIRVVNEQGQNVYIGKTIPLSESTNMDYIYKL